MKFEVNYIMNLLCNYDHNQIFQSSEYPAEYLNCDNFYDYLNVIRQNLHITYLSELIHSLLDRISGCISGLIFKSPMLFIRSLRLKYEKKIEWFISIT